MVSEDRIAYIRTSDRSNFKRCRRKWTLESGLHFNREPIDRPSYFWIGTGGHFALEDYHGHNYYGHPVEAFRAYVEAQKRWVQQSRNTRRLPSDWEEQAELGEGILDYYLEWGSERDLYQTLWINGHPQVEIRCEVELEVPDILRDNPRFKYDRIIYNGTIDRVVEIDGELFILDWKFYKTMQDSPYLDYDQQMSAYIWLASTIYDRPIAGAILYQFRKALPKSPRILSSGKISTAEKQGTTHRLYRRALEELYGNVNKAPSANLKYLSDLAAREAIDRDDFIRRDKTYRTPEHQASTGTKIMMEICDMLNPDLLIYPNETKDCSWQCNLQDICLMIDRDDDWESLLHETTVTREADDDSWRNHLPT